jgi:hypothetical protein
MIFEFYFPATESQIPARFTSHQITLSANATRVPETVVKWTVTADQRI